MLLHHIDDLLPAFDQDHVYRPVLASDNLSVGFATWAAGSVDTQRPHDEDEVYHVVAGRARIDVDGDSEDVGPGSLIFVRAGVPHHFYGIAEMLHVLVFWAPPHAADVMGLEAPTPD